MSMMPISQSYHVLTAATRYVVYAICNNHPLTNGTLSQDYDALIDSIFTNTAQQILILIATQRSLSNHYRYCHYLGDTSMRSGCSNRHDINNEILTVLMLKYTNTTRV
eukprot:521052_1